MRVPLTLLVFLAWAAVCGGASVVEPGDVQLHGTPEPSRVGHAASHGCLRLTNWDVMRVAAFATKGTRVVFEE